VHQSKFSMGTVLALAARFRHAGLPEFEQHFLDADTVALRERVSMEFDAEVDAAYPARWIGKVTVITTDGRRLHGRVDEPKGDPGNTLDRDELRAKALQLAAFSGAATEVEMQVLLDRAWSIARAPRVAHFLAREI
jgi:2-methylcitrate dehydratase PrpD